MNCPLCNEEMDEPTLTSVKFSCDWVLYEYYETNYHSYYIRESHVPNGPWHQIITSSFILNWFEKTKEISIYKVGGSNITIDNTLFLKENNKSLQDLVNLYHRLNNLKVFL